MQPVQLHVLESPARVWEYDIFPCRQQLSNSQMVPSRRCHCGVLSCPAHCSNCDEDEDEDDESSASTAIKNGG